jgi:hypothetical protein
MDAIEQMFHVLVRTLRIRNPALLTSPFTVGDMHQHLIPYRHFRRELGLETNQEYELTMMQLVSGTGGYLDVDERLRDGLGRELASPSPEPSKVREFAEAQVSLNQAALAKIPESRATPARSLPGQSPIAPAGAGSGLESCRYCGGQLPLDRPGALNFCPHCGQNLQVHNCPACGAELEAGWKFCVACGKSVA